MQNEVRIILPFINPPQLSATELVSLTRDNVKFLRGKGIGNIGPQEAKEGMQGERKGLTFHD